MIRLRNKKLFIFSALLLLVSFSFIVGCGSSSTEINTPSSSNASDSDSAPATTDTTPSTPSTPTTPDTSVNNTTPTPQGKFVGSSSSDKYHDPDCRYAKKIKAANQVWFADYHEAQSKGYVPCKVCKPEGYSAEQSYSSSSKQQTSSDITVYVTNTGEKYHRDGCRYLSKSQIPITLSDAQSQGYTPCSVCDP